MMKMGLWTWAELTTGILISCMPVLPKFFQILTAKVQGPLSRLSKSVTRSTDNSGSTEIKKKTTVSVQYQLPSNIYKSAIRPFGTWNDSYKYQASAKGANGDDMSMVNANIALPGNAARPGQSHRYSEGLTTRREDLEIGRRTG